MPEFLFDITFWTALGAIGTALVAGVAVLRAWRHWTGGQASDDSTTKLKSVQIAGQEMGYFKHLIECINNAPTTEHMKAYIRLTAFTQDHLAIRSWFEGVYKQFIDAVEKGQLQIEYIFLVSGAEEDGPTRDFIDRFKRFASKISIIHPDDPRIAQKFLRPSVVLLQTQRIAFTHDRKRDGSMIDAKEWRSQNGYEFWESRYKAIELAGEVYFECSK